MVLWQYKLNLSNFACFVIYNSSFPSLISNPLQNNGISSSFMSFSTPGKHNFYIELSEPISTMESMFELCIANIDMSGKNTNKVKTVYKMFKSFGGTSINMSGCSLADSTNNQEFIYNALKLTDFVAPSNIKSSMDIIANNLTVDSLLSVINALDLVETSQELEIGATNIGKLSDEQILFSGNTELEFNYFFIL